MTATWDVTLWLNDVETFDYGDHGNARLPWQYRGNQPRLQALLLSFMDRLQSLEDVSIDVLAGRWPLTAVGDQLDTVGAIVGQARGEMVDAQYRLFIAAKILVNQSTGCTADIGEILAVMGYPDIDMLEYAGELLVSVAGSDYGEIIGPFVSDAGPGGIMFRWVHSDEADADTFQLSATLGADDTDTDSGFGALTEATQTTGGSFSGGLTP